MMIVFLSTVTTEYMMSGVAKEKAFKGCDELKMLSDCRFQVMKCWCVLKEMAFWAHVSPEFTAFLKKCCCPVLSDKVDMRISTGKFNQFRGK